MPILMHRRAAAQSRGEIRGRVVVVLFQGRLLKKNMTLRKRCSQRLKIMPSAVFVLLVNAYDNNSAHAFIEASSSSMFVAILFSFCSFSVPSKTPNRVAITTRSESRQTSVANTLLAVDKLLDGAVFSECPKTGEVSPERVLLRKSNRQVR